MKTTKIEGSKILQVGMFAFVLVLGLVSPQKTEAADEAGIQRLGFYLDNVTSQGKALSKTEVDEIEKIIRKDGKVDADEYRFIYNLLDDNDYFDNQILSGDRLKIIQAIHDDYADYSDEVKEKYPELIDLDNKLPLDLREQIDGLVLTNILAKEHLIKESPSEYFIKNSAATWLADVKESLDELQKNLAGSPYKTFLTKIYNAEKLLLAENLKKLNER